MRVFGGSLVLACLLVARCALAQAPSPAPVEGDFVARSVRFDSGEVAPEIRLHYRTIGRPRKDAGGIVRNAVLILHGTGGNGGGFVSDGYAGRLFGKGQLLDAERRPAHEVPALPLRRHGAAAASPGHRAARPDAPAAGNGHVDGGDARVAVGLHVSVIRRRPGATRQQPRGNRRPQPRVAQAAGRRDRHRSHLAGRQLHYPAALPAPGSPIRSWRA